MIEKQIHILSTRPLDLSLLEAAASEGITIDVLSFISTQPIEGSSVVDEIADAALAALTVRFTSRHAIDAVVAHLGRRPAWKIFCTGYATRKLAEEHFGREAIAGVADSAAELAEKIIATTVIPNRLGGKVHPARDVRPSSDVRPASEEIIFFCGDQRREELPKRLSEKGIRFREVLVYRTVLTPRHVENEYDGIIFFSPSGVTSFFSSNKPAPGCILFAIGPTTAEAIRAKCGNTIFVNDSPSREELIREIIRYIKSGQSI